MPSNPWWLRDESVMTEYFLCRIFNTEHNTYGGLVSHLVSHSGQWSATPRARGQYRHGARAVVRPHCKDIHRIWHAQSTEYRAHSTQHRTHIFVHRPLPLSWKRPCGRPRQFKLFIILRLWSIIGENLFSQLQESRFWNATNHNTLRFKSSNYITYTTSNYSLYCLNEEYRVAEYYCVS